MRRLYLVRDGKMWRLKNAHQEGQLSFLQPPPIVDEPFRIKLFAVMAAVNAAKQLHADTGDTVSLMIQNRYGHWQEERTYPQSGDPQRTHG